MNKDEYLDRFKSEEKVEIDSKHLEAFRLAVETRKFEIELYWKRATYFWAFIAVTFAGYGASLRLNDSSFISFFLSCFGLVLSLGWYYANRGSKQWQENWEHHVDHLGERIVGPLFKLVLRRRAPENFGEIFDRFIFGPSKHSVSKINQLISLYITLMWLVLIYRTQDSWVLCTWSFESLAILAFTILAVIGIFLAKTHVGTHTHSVDERDAVIKS